MRKIFCWTLLFGLVVSVPVSAGYWCGTWATDCSAAATVWVPTGGSCNTDEGSDWAWAVAYNASGELVDREIDHCDPRICI